jgi:CBS domain-containing protein
MSTVATILAHKGRNVASVTENDSVLDAARLMRERHIGSVVVAKDGDIHGIFTERDMLCRVVAEGRNPAQTRIGEVMTLDVACATPEMSLLQIASTMTQKRLRHMPVAEHGKLCGMITSGDILAYKVSHLEETNIFLKEYMHGQQLVEAE